eukprot:1529425-Pleurochrysis_carterae.AAC.1
MSQKRAPNPRALPSHAAGRAVCRHPPFACNTAHVLRRDACACALSSLLSLSRHLVQCHCC